MINIVLYGKPRAFESHEYAFDNDKPAAVDNSFPEPLVKPKAYDNVVLHYFSRAGYSGVEYYNRAKGYESDRDGIVFGLALKTDYDYSIGNVIDNVLERYWSDFAGVLLNNENRFVSPSILGVLNGVKWGDDDVSIIRNALKQCEPPTPKKKLCLLYAPEYDKISAVESQLKEYADVYISDNIEIFKDLINSVVLKMTDGVIHTIKDGTIAVFEGGKTLPPLPRKNPPKWGGKKDEPEPEKSRDVKKGVAVPVVNEKVYVDDFNGREEKIGSNDNKKRWIVLAITAAIIAVILVILLLVKPSPKQDGSGSNADSVEVPDTEVQELANEITVAFNSYDSPIKQSLPLEVEINKPKNSSYASFNIKLEVDRTDLVRIDNEGDNYKLVVINNPESETDVKVLAKCKDVVVGDQTYKIAAKQKTEMSKDTKSGGATAGVSGTAKPDARNSESPVYEDVKIIITDGDNRAVQILKRNTLYNVMAIDKNKRTVKGKWKFDKGDLQVTDVNKNPTQIQSDKHGEYKISFEFFSNGKEKKVGPISVVYGRQ